MNKKIQKIITENNPAAPKDILEQKLEDLDEIEKAEEESEKRIMNKFNEIFPNVRRD